MAATSMRVIAGAARGVPLQGPRDRRTRPTAARLRESLFGMLEAADVDMSAVLDLYAGTGALGIEALSRGDGHCAFVEMDAATCRVIRANLSRTRLADRATVVRGAVGRWRAKPDDCYTLVIADPPYDHVDAWRAIERSVDGALAAHALIAIEHRAREAPPAAMLGRPRWRDRRQGDGAVAIYRSASGSGSGEDAA